ncbi:hypothetical protein EYB45_01105 [Erythrobacteraceae bacterium CFH 75059]|uniref:hypothetical protein n=1 Tax=Qipengyuania thermophila TaxID=2509361 RepID=UPI00101F28CC|nr:hypothetical protein [Qipengyuania thermophila]TCD06361.1 hypothetical protein EYB45_01105 [Erythrobacteraceae bacterium CFH 75059]
MAVTALPPAPAALTALLALAFCAVHLRIGRLRFLHAEPRSRWLSFAGGVAVAYVVMHMLPELAGHERALAVPFGAAFAGSAVYGLTLLGLVLFYGVERAMLISRRQPAAGPDADADRQAGAGVFWLHIGCSALLAAIVAYLLENRDTMTAAGTMTYFTAMALHFATADFGSRAHHPHLYDRGGRWVLAGATIGGWGLGLVVDLQPAVVGGMFAFVAGGIILTVLKEELPAEREGRFFPFLAGALLYGALVLAEEWLAHG